MGQTIVSAHPDRPSRTGHPRQQSGRAPWPTRLRNPSWDFEDENEVKGDQALDDVVITSLLVDLKSNKVRGGERPPCLPPLWKEFNIWQTLQTAQIFQTSNKDEKTLKPYNLATISNS